MSDNFKSVALSTDSNDVHIRVIELIKTGEAESYLEALSIVFEDIDVDDINFKKILTPTLYQLVLTEAIEKNMVIGEQSNASGFLDLF